MRPSSPGVDAEAVDVDPRAERMPVSTISSRERPTKRRLRLHDAFMSRPNTIVLPGGKLPLNTNGGGLSYAHSGMYGMFALQESVRQVQAILTADLVIVGPGSLYTSLLPNLLVQDLLGAVQASRALKVS